MSGSVPFDGGGGVEVGGAGGGVGAQSAQADGGVEAEKWRVAAVREKAWAMRRVQAGLAAEDAAEFCAFVLRDEQTGGAIEPKALHLTWHRLCDKYPRLVLWSHVESGKTQQLAIGRPLWVLGKDPSKRIAIISNTFGQAQKIVRTIARYIESSRELHEVFPGLQPGDQWTANALTVKRPGVGSKDPSVQACGVHGNITGSRLELVVLDDVLDFENTRTFSMRQDLWDWFYATVVGRLTEWGRIYCIGTAYHPDDLLHRLAKPVGGGGPGVWYSARFPVVNAQGESSWPERWPHARIEQRRVELGAVEFARQMLCKARDDEEARFQREWLEACMERGKGLTLLPRLDILPEGAGTYSGVDIGVKDVGPADPTCIFTVLVHPNGDRQPIGIETGKWSGPEIVRRIIATHEKYHSIIYVENNAAQEFILQFTREQANIPVRAFTTGRNKAHPEFGVEGIAVEMQNKKWIIPCDEVARGSYRLSPEVDAWVNELLYYDPREHTGDRLMASWFAREGARRHEGKKRGSVGIKVIG